MSYISTTLDRVIRKKKKMTSEKKVHMVAVTICMAMYAMYGYVGLFMAMYGYVGICWVMYGCVWLCGAR